MAEIPMISLYNCVNCDAVLTDDELKEHRCSVTIEPTQQQKREDLARAMFPKALITPAAYSDGVDIVIYDKPNETRSWYDFNPFTSAEDSRRLVEWLAADDARWERFVIRLCLFESKPAIQIEYIELFGRRQVDIVGTAKRLMTAPLPVIAEAAWQAITAQPKASSLPSSDADTHRIQEKE